MVETGNERSFKEQLRDRTAGWWKVSAIGLVCMMFLFPSYVLSNEEIPENVSFVIDKKAVAQFPHDKNSQMRVIEAQKSAYITVKNYTNKEVPGYILTDIKKRAASECPTNYCAQKYLVEKQARDCGYLMNYSCEDVPHRILKRMLKNAKVEFPNDFSTQRMAVEQKVEKYLSWDRVTQLEYYEKELDASLGEMEILLCSLQTRVETGTQRAKESEKTKATKDVSQKAIPTIAEVRKTEPPKAAVTDVDIQKQQVLRAEKEESIATATTRQYHVVKKGENLYRISLRYGLSLDRVCAMNGITPEHTIWPGQRILVSP